MQAMKKQDPIDVRREQLRPMVNPEPLRECLVQFSYTHPRIHRTTHIWMVPEESLLSPEDLSAYLERWASDAEVGLENLVRQVRDDLANQLIPRWVRVEMIEVQKNMTQRVVAEDMQPQWSESALVHEARGGSIRPRNGA